MTRKPTIKYISYLSIRNVYNFHAANMEFIDNKELKKLENKDEDLLEFVEGTMENSSKRLKTMKNLLSLVKNVVEKEERKYISVEPKIENRIVNLKKIHERNPILV